MRVAIDARPALDARRTGVGQYADRLVRTLPIADPETSYTAWYLHVKGLLRPRAFFPQVAEAAANFGERATRFPARVFEPMASRLGIPRVESFVDFDVFLATNFLPPATRGRFVMMVHDLAFRVMPETAPHHDRRWHRRFERALETAGEVLVPSESARGDLLRFYDVDPERVEVIPHGVDPVPPRRSSASDRVATRASLGVGDEPYVLFVGGIEPRKNLVALIRAFARGSPQRARLVIAGGPVRWFPTATRALDEALDALPSPARERIVRLGYVGEDEKRDLLAHATVLAYPSRYEGFGLPVLEAMAAGIPVLTSNVSSLPEVAGKAAVLVDPDDVDAIAEGVRWLLEDEGLRDRLRAAGRERAATFSWHETARQTAAALRRAAGLGERFPEPGPQERP
jgi:glycosyltransferase involved in cell wall biosynthesis